MSTAPSSAPAIASDPSAQAAPIPAPSSEAVEGPRGQLLPGDRDPREFEAGSQRPSFWRRIALGRRSQSLRAAQLEQDRDEEMALVASEARTDANGHAPARIDERAAARTGGELTARSTAAAERRIVEPLLQALVSVEAKLERSHVDLIARSDQVEQRLTQLWDIEEQLGALGELQESVLHVTEQQRRLESALVAQTRILRWLVGGIILSLAVAAFSVAFFLRVSG
jgi:hypothetical protein